MYLKRLESVGFKSFAERINVDFVPGVTAVVGPNGSGKSNITDALRWVLGEQSARSLRGSKMEDIIFQGSDSRKQLNVAEVTIVLDNSDNAVPLDYEEVSVTRRVYRSGDSEFYINKQSCRLKDIVDLFMDSGLGREAFSIISQGKVEEILSSKAEERRTIFEEAAGVLKYKQRKKKAEYKLAETQENLNRVEDIIHEIEQQIDPLEQQAETAKEYQELKEQLKDQEISLLITEIEQLHEEWKLLLASIEKEKMTEIELKTTIQQKEAMLENERQHIQNLDEQIEALQTELLTLTQELEQHEGKKRVLNERIKHYAENKTELEAQKEEASARIERLKADLKEEEAKLADSRAKRNETKQNVEHIEAKLTTEKENIADQIEELKAEYIEYLNNQAAKRNEKQSIGQQLQQIKMKRDRQSQKFSGLLAAREELDSKQVQTNESLVKQVQLYQENESTLKGLKGDLDHNRKHFQESQTKLYQGYQYLEKLKSKKEMLEEMKEDFQGFFYGVKEVLKARQEQKLNAIHGAVIELVDVPKDYITAIETVLGGQAQHIVVQDDMAARKAITWLKQNNKGRATFLPLGSIQPRYITKDVLAKVENHHGFIGIAANLIKCNEKYQKAIDHLMGHVVIAKTLKDANEIAGIVMRRYRIVTLEGDVVNPGGSMSGGAQKKTNQSLFTRDKDLQDTTKKLDEFQKKAAAFENTVKEQKLTIEKQEAQLETQQNELTYEQQSLQKLQSELNEIELKQGQLNENLTIYDQEKKQYDSDTNELQSRDAKLAEELNDIDCQLTAIQKQIDELSKQDTQFKENQEQLQHDFHQYQVTLAEQEERVKNQREKTNGLQSQLDEQNEHYNQVTQRLAELMDLNQNEVTEEEINEQIKTKQAAKEKITGEIQQKRTDRTGRTQLIKDQERELKEENKKHQTHMQAIQTKEVKANRLDVDLENRLTHLQEEYTLTFERAKETYDKARDTEQAKNIVIQIKQKIERLGTVNLGAIDEYERVSERYTFLTDQRDDLVQAKQTLHTVISEMDVEMENRFETTFSAIKAEFEIVFKELFGGGRAELKLTDPKNLLETGVDIVAEPPGKKLQHLGLLSGGERALTAIALLFAILRVRPVPFCVLDEVEAALDEANVARFAKYVKVYSENTQFIVITHRKGTMEEADVLYGVTMQESGVSRLVSVRLEDTKELVKA
ncbi:chromosome segregation protein SMC [Virgibacillus oceani]|uniref:Chromosome partition protein Smc n=1 Tax=Virgibacillus oceani TaxID=1479511 RepID=A0A917M1I8_9BACI|nr:chromosome segregation protein SMC [Virgibacillus oceani]GGG69224.1 chromosome partition protein Smc [Virgibacillus oceani]